MVRLLGWRRMWSRTGPLIEIIARDMGQVISHYTKAIELNPNRAVQP